MGMVCCDFDRDGDTDIVVGNDVAGNFFFRNDGRGHFVEIGLLTGLAYDLSGKPQATMGVDAGDFDNDGLIDVYVTSFQMELATLYKNTGNAMFKDVTRLTGAGEGNAARRDLGLRTGRLRQRRSSRHLCRLRSSVR